jgi:predicted dehydrogenase
MDDVRIGVIGVGGMGGNHVRWITNDIEGAVVTAICDIDPERLARVGEPLGESVARFDNADDLFEADICDAITIATPHYDHPPLAIQGFEKSLHVLTEKPAGVYTKQVKEMNEAAHASGKVFAIMFQQRTSPVYRKVKELIDSGEVGRLRRVDWVITDWFRTQAYYNSGGWRATWSGEGGGVLMNQCPHNIDLWQWMFGVPSRRRATCYYGKYHDIEVEDEVFALMEYENGCVGTFMTSTGESPGTNRLEVWGDHGKIILERGKLCFKRTRGSVQEFLETNPGRFSTPEAWNCEVPLPRGDGGHREILRHFIDKINGTGELIASGLDGINSLQMANAMLLSSWTGDGWADVPIDDDLYCEKLEEKRAASKGKEPVADASIDDLDSSW